MSVVITERCINCGACEWECPNMAISPGDPHPVVNQDLCTECYGFFGESQCIVVCPVDAIVVIPETTEVLEKRFVRTNPTAKLQDQWIWQRVGRAR